MVIGNLLEANRASENRIKAINIAKETGTHDMFMYEERVYR